MDNKIRDIRKIDKIERLKTFLKNEISYLEKNLSSKNDAFFLCELYMALEDISPYIGIYIPETLKNKYRDILSKVSIYMDIVDQLEKIITGMEVLKESIKIRKSEWPK